MECATLFANAKRFREDQGEPDAKGDNLQKESVLCLWQCQGWSRCILLTYKNGQTAAAISVCEKREESCTTSRRGEKNKPKKVQTKARKAMSRGFLVLELRPQGLDLEPEPGEVPPLSDQTFSAWVGVLAEMSQPKCPEGQRQSTFQRHKARPQSLWLHLGYCNFKSMQWTGLKMARISSRNDGLDDSEQVELALQNPVECFRCFEFLQQHASFGCSYQARFWILQSRKLSLNQVKMIPDKLLAKPFTGIPPLVVWKGSKAEAQDRDALKEEQARRDGRNLRKREAPKERIERFLVPKTKKTRPGRPEQPLAGGSPRASECDADMGGEGESGGKELELEDPFEEETMSEHESDDSAGSGDQDEDAFDLDEFFSQSMSSSSSSDSDSDTASNSSRDSGADNQPAQASGNQVARSSSDGDAAASGAVVEPETGDSSSAPARLPRDMFPDVLQVGTWGELRFYRKTNNIVAHCSKHIEQDCRRSRTMVANSARPGQGRPIGLLVAWLQDPDCHEQGRAATHSRADRKAAREFYNSLPNAKEFGCHERQREQGECDEPDVIP